MRNHRLARRVEAGFTLIETLIAAIVMVVGILGMAAMLGTAIVRMTTCQYDYIAQEKASEAVESIFTARDMGQLSWSSICNTGSGVCTAGIFTGAPTSLCDPGPDGIVGTADDNCALPDAVLMPNGSTINNVTNSRVPLTNFNFQRTITITNVAGMANLRQISVVITYQVGPLTRNYTMVTNISNVT